MKKPITPEEAAKRLAALGGTMPYIKDIPRRKVSAVKSEHHKRTGRKAKLN